MEKIYIPEEKRCCMCNRMAQSPKDKDWRPMRMIGFKEKPHRWVFCEWCFVKLMRVSNTQFDGKCPRKRVFKMLTGKEPIPSHFFVRGTIHGKVVG